MAQNNKSSNKPFCREFFALSFNIKILYTWELQFFKINAKTYILGYGMSTVGFA